MPSKKRSKKPRGTWMPMFQHSQLPAAYMGPDGRELGTVTGAFGGGWIATIAGISSAAYPDGELAKRCVEEGLVGLA